MVNSNLTKKFELYIFIVSIYVTHFLIRYTTISGIFKPKSQMDIVDSYNKSYYSLVSTHNTINIEFELRIANFDYFKFIDVVNRLNNLSESTSDELNGPARRGETIKQYKPCEIENTMNAIIEEPIELKPSNTKLKDASLIMTMKFDMQGRKTQYGNGEYKSYSRKWRIGRSNEILNPLFKYSINVSGEQVINTDIKPDSNSLIRIKCRLSYYIEIVSAQNSRKWRIDLTITKQFQAFNSTDISLYINKMFKHDEPMTPNNFMKLLKLDDTDTRQLYNYELEIEYMNPDNVLNNNHSLSASDITDIVKFISSITQSNVLSDTKYQSVIYDIAKHIVTNPDKLKRFKHDLGIKQLLPGVIPLTANTYKDIYPPTGYYLLDKADGIRSVLIINDTFMYLISDKMIEFELPKKYNTTIVDGEFIGNTLYIFDVIMCDGEDLTKFGYEIRNDSIEACVNIFEAINTKKTLTINVAAKPRVYITDFKPDDLKRQFNDPVLQNRPYETDGLIMVKPDNNYMMTITYKWKSAKNNTIDFLIKKVQQHLVDELPEQLRPKSDFVLYYLFVGINNNMFNKLGLHKVDGYDEIFKSDGYRTTDKYFPIQFSISDSPFAYFYYCPKELDSKGYSGKYVEMRCSGGCTAAGNLGMPNWDFVKVRDDRAREKSNYFGNDYKTAEINWTNYLAPFKKEQLWNGPVGGYFMTVKNKLYKDQTAFTSFVKSQRINTMTNYNWVVDAAIGKGQDFLRYVNANIRHLVGIDIDQIALTELIRRKLQNAGTVIREYNNPLTLFILNADLSKDYKEIANKITSIEGYPAAGANAMVINLAIHYMCDTTDHITNFVKLCANLVASGGKMVITAMFGELVHKLLIDNNIETGKAWSKYQDGVLKYSIRKDYNAKEMVDVGQAIGVLLPFSVGDYYTESLVNTDYIIALYAEYGFDLVEKVPFSKYFRIYETHSQSRFRQLTSDDLEFLSLYGEIILKKR